MMRDCENVEMRDLLHKNRHTFGHDDPASSVKEAH